MFTVQVARVAMATIEKCTWKCHCCGGGGGDGLSV